MLSAGSWLCCTTLYFFSRDELNTTTGLLLDRPNQMLFTKLLGTHRSAVEVLDQPALSRPEHFMSTPKVDGPTRYRTN